MLSKDNYLKINVLLYNYASKIFKHVSSIKIHGKKLTNVMLHETFSLNTKHVARS